MFEKGGKKKVHFFFEDRTLRFVFDLMVSFGFKTRLLTYLQMGVSIYNNKKKYKNKQKKKDKKAKESFPF